MKKNIFIGPSVGTLFLLATTIGLFSPVHISLADDSDKVIARVDGKEITEAQIGLAEAEIGAELVNIPNEQRRFTLMEYLIEIQMLANAAEKDSLGKESSFESRLKYYHRRALRDAYFEKKIRDAVPEEAAKEIYEAQIKGLKPEQEVHARHILLTSEEDAKALIKELAGGADFAELAKEKSTGPSAPQGGDLGYFSRGRMIKSFEEAAFSLKAGEISEPVKSDFGWHVIKVEDKRDRPVPPFDAVKGRIMAQLIQRKSQEIAATLRQESKVEILDEELKKKHEELEKRAYGR